MGMVCAECCIDGLKTGVLVVCQEKESQLISRLLTDLRLVSSLMILSKWLRKKEWMAAGSNNKVLFTLNICVCIFL